MKHLTSLIVCCSWICGLLAQTPVLALSTTKTTSLIFPFPVKHVDRGTGAVLVQQVKEADNILLIKAAVSDFSETNVSVITSDGSLYCFMVRYQSSPEQLVYYLPVQSSASTASYAQNILDNPPTLRGPGKVKWGIEARLTGIYVKGEVLFFQLQLINRSTIDYELEELRFLIRDKKKTRRTAVQQWVLQPLVCAGSTSQIKAESKVTLVWAFPKFTLPDQKFLAIDIKEKNGGRQLPLKVTNRQIIRAIVLPDYK